MAAMRRSVVNVDPNFVAQQNALRQNRKFPEIDAVIDDLRDLLLLDYPLTEMPVDRNVLPGVYAIKLDYPPMGSNGRGVLLASYHATQAAGLMREPYRTITLLTLTDLTA